MQKIISLFQRNYETDRLVRNEIVPGAGWVINGEGIATRKWDGTACKISDGKLYKRYDAKNGKTPPPNFEPAQDEPDPNTRHWPGWVPVRDAPEDARHREAFDQGFCIIDEPVFQQYRTGPLEPGTYELCGPKVNGNPEGFDHHYLVKHGSEVLLDVTLNYEGINAYLSEVDIEGIVWHHPDGRMVKIKKKDFGLKR